MLNNQSTTQEERVLSELIKAQGDWLSSDYFERTLMLSQFHRAKHNLIHHKERYGYNGEIETSDFRNEYGFLSYRIKPKELKQEGLPIRLSQQVYF